MVIIIVNMRIWIPHNWTDDMLRTASAQNHNVTINGGSEKTKISFSVNYLNDDGIKIKSGYERFSTNLKLKQELAKGLSFELMHVTSALMLKVKMRLEVDVVLFFIFCLSVSSD